MRKKITFSIIGMLFIVNFGYGQLKVVLYNTGKMNISGNTVLYLAGDLVTDNYPSTPGANIRVGAGTIVLTGNLRHNVFSETSRGSYTNAFSRAAPGGKLEFRGENMQEIRSDSVRSSAVPFERRPLKSIDYILFPDSVIINNVHSVVMDPRIAGEMNNVRLKKGIFVLDSRFPDANDYPTSIIPVLPSAPYNSMIAHLKVTGAVKYPYYDLPPSSIVNYDEVGRFQVNLVVNPDDESDDLTSSYGSPYKRMYGMTSPFEAVRSDYFMFNTLTFPDPAGFLGASSATIRSPEIELKAGKGFFVGIDLRGSDENAYKNLIDDKYTQIMFDNRAVDKYVFNRFKFMGNPNNLYPVYGGINTSIYQAEKIVTDNIPFTLQKGYNYLGNSFLAPLSVKDLVETTNGSLLSNWNVRPGNETAVGREIMNRVWVANPNTRAYEEGLSIYYYHSYYTIKPEGGTYTGGDISAGDEFLIPPLQLFRVYSYSNSPINIAIPKSNVTHGANMFLRSGGKERYDDFVFEVIDSETRTTDRVCVLLRNPSELRSSSEDDKLSFKSEVVQISENGRLKLRSGSLPEQSAMSLLYLKTESGNAVDEKQLSTTTSYEDLYMTPSWIPQTIYIRGLRLHTMKNIRTIWLEDKKFGTKTLMMPDTYYKTTSEPADADDRFRLWFSTEPVNAAVSTEIHFDIYYDNLQKTLVAGTFEEADFGSLISVYDLQGKLCFKEIVNQPVMLLTGRLASGVYIVKMSGGRTGYVTKILVK